MVGILHSGMQRGTSSHVTVATPAWYTTVGPVAPLPLRHRGGKALMALLEEMKACFKPRMNQSTRDSLLPCNYVLFNLFITLQLSETAVLHF